MKIYAVGGVIRDALLGIPCQDADYVVVGATPELMIQAGFTPVGSDFPVFLHPKSKQEYALARTERKSGVGYKGFTFQASPEVTLEEDLSRRDLTMNAIAREVDLNGNQIGPLIDPYGGQTDLKEKRFRHVSPAFVEDPLRVLRLARFAARFPEFKTAPETAQLLKQLVQSNELAYLVVERIWQEISKGLLAIRPSRMLEELASCGALERLFPKDFNRSDVLQTTCQFVDSAATQGLNLPQRFAALMALIDFEQAREWFEQMKIPSDCRAFAEIFRIWSHTYVSQLNAQSMMVFFDRADAWRKPARLHEVFDLADCLKFPTSSWRVALKALEQVDAGEIAGTMPGANGELIREAIHQARLKVVAASL